MPRPTLCPVRGAITAPRCTAAQNWLTGAPDLATAVVCVPAPESAGRLWSKGNDASRSLVTVNTRDPPLRTSAGCLLKDYRCHAELDDLMCGLVRSADDRRASLPV